MFCFTTERGLRHDTHYSLQMLTEPKQMGIRVALEALKYLQTKGPRENAKPGKA